MSQVWDGSYVAKSVVGWERRYEDHVFPEGTKYVGLWDHVGTAEGAFDDPKTWGNMKDCEYIRKEASSFYRSFCRAKFQSPCIVQIGEAPYPRRENGDVILGPGAPEINCASMFFQSDIMLLPHMLDACHLMIANCNNMFSGCARLTYLMPQELRPLGLSDVKDPKAPRLLRSNSSNHPGLFFQLRPKTAVNFMKGCTAYQGNGINMLSLRNIATPDGANGIFEGCEFQKPYLDGLLASIHWEFFHRKLFKGPLHGVNLGRGHLVGQAATHYHELRDAGIEVIVEP